MKSTVGSLWFGIFFVHLWVHFVCSSTHLCCFLTETLSGFLSILKWTGGLYYLVLSLYLNVGHCMLLCGLMCFTISILFLFILHVWVFFLHVCIYYVCASYMFLVIVVFRRHHWIPKDWSYWWLWTMICVMGPNIWSSQKIVSSLNHGAISPVLNNYLPFCICRGLIYFFIGNNYSLPV